MAQGSCAKSACLRGDCAYVAVCECQLRAAKMNSARGGRMGVCRYLQAHALTVLGTSRWSMDRVQESDYDGYRTNQKHPSHYAIWDMRESNRKAEAAGMKLPYPLLPVLVKTGLLLASYPPAPLQVLCRTLPHACVLCMAQLRCRPLHRPNTVHARLWPWCRGSVLLRLPARADRQRAEARLQGRPQLLPVRQVLEAPQDVQVQGLLQVTGRARC